MKSETYFTAPLLDCSTCCRSFLASSPIAYRAECPYCGAHYFAPEDAAYFDALRAEIVKRHENLHRVA